VCLNCHVNILPKFERCPCCLSINFFKINGAEHKHGYKSLSNFKLIKKFKCKRCKEEIGIFLNRSNELKKLIWLSEINCEENYYDRLKKLKDRKNKLNKTKLSVKHDSKASEILSEIESINKAVHECKIKLKIKFKIQKRTGIDTRLFDI